MPESTDEMVTFRLGPKDRAAIAKLVEDGEFRNRSDFLRYAVKSGLKDFQPSTMRGRMDLDLEATELPAHHEPARRSSGRARRGMGQ